MLCVQGRLSLILLSETIFSYFLRSIGVNDKVTTIILNFTEHEFCKKLSEGWIVRVCYFTSKTQILLIKKPLQYFEIINKSGMRLLITVLNLFDTCRIDVFKKSADVVLSIIE